MLQFIKNKITNKKLLNLSLLVGVILLAGLLCVYPMFREGSLNKLLLTMFEDYIEESETYPAVINRNGLLTEGEFTSVDALLKEMDGYEKVWSQYLGASVIEREQLMHVAGGSANTSFGDKSRVVTLGYMPNLYDHADVVYGVSAEEADTSENEYVKRALDKGAYPVVISEVTMDKYGLVVGEELSFKFRLYDDDEDEQLFVITGIIEEREDEGIFWFNRLEQNEKMLFMCQDAFEKAVLESGRYELHYDLNVMYDYTYFNCDNASDSLYYLNQFKELDEHVYPNFDNILSGYLEQEKAISVILLTFELPIVALLLLFLYMISGRILEMETTEISMLKSRGVSRGKIIGLYVSQSSIISVFGCIIGLPVGYFMCKLAASTNAFLSFSLKDISVYRPTIMMLPFAGIAFVLSVLFMTLPVISLSRLTITDRKGIRISTNNKPFWEKYFIDIILLGISGYLLYNYYKQSDALSAEIIGGGTVDPVIFLDSTLFILSCGLVFIRLSGYLVRLINRIGRKKWSPANFVAFLQIIRGVGKQGFISVFLVMTIAMGVFNANLARTVNENAENRTRYNIGADLQMQEKWKLTVVRADPSDPHPLWSYTEPDFERYKELSELGVEKMTRVIYDTNTDIIVNKKAEKGNTLMAINTKEFGETARLQDGVNDTHWFNYLNKLADAPTGVLISSNLAGKYELKEGDKIKYERYSPTSSEPYKTVESKICGIVDAFPGYESTSYTTKDDGTVEMHDNFLIVANYATVVNDFTITPYSIWMRLKDGADPAKIKSAIEEKGAEITAFKDLDEEIQIQRDSAMIQITNGMFSIGFIISLLICAVGFLIYWVLTIKERELLYGIYRAMGMSMREILKMLTTEQIFSSLLAALSGFGVGAITTMLFTKLISIVYLPRKHNLPIEIFIKPDDSIKMIIIIVAAFTICFAVMSKTIKDMNITKALKMGED